MTMPTTELEQTTQVLNSLREMRQRFTQYHSLWKLLGEACEPLESRIRTLTRRDASREEDSDGTEV